MGVDGVDGVIRPVMAALSASQAIWAVVALGLTVIVTAVMVVAVVLVIMTVIVVIVAPVITMVIIAALMVSRAGSPFNFFDVSILVCHLYQFANGCRPLVVQLAMELLMPEPFGEGSDGLGIRDVRNGVSCF